MRKLVPFVGLVMVLASCAEGAVQTQSEAPSTAALPAAQSLGNTESDDGSSTPSALGDDAPSLIDREPQNPVPGDSAGSEGGEVIDPQPSDSSAAGAEDPADPEDPPEPEDLPEAVTTTAPAGATGEVPAALLTAVLEDFSARTGLAPDQAAVTIAESTIWPDGSLGCPAPGAIYEAAPVPGYRVFLEAAGSSYNYHLADSGYFVLCSAPLPAHP